MNEKEWKGFNVEIVDEEQELSFFINQKNGG